MVSTFKLNLGPALMVAGILAVGVPFVIWKLLRIERWVPLTVTQITAGLLLGPTILGGLMEARGYKVLYDSIFAGPGLTAINAIAVIAVALFGFLAGIGADKEVIKKSAGMTLATGIASFVGPLLIGTVVGYFIALALPSVIGPTGSPLVFGLAFGLVMSITALPVLAAILVESGIMKARASSVALAGAGVGNAFVWIGLALILALAAGNMPAGGEAADTMKAAAPSTGIGSALLYALGGLAALAVWCLVFAFIMNKLPTGPKSDNLVLATALVMVAAAAMMADRSLSGLDAVIGAFVAGLFVPENRRKQITEMLERPVLVILVPFFFLFAGLNTKFAGADASLYWVLVAGLLVAVLGKVFCTAAAAKACGESWAFGNILGVFHQTKGLIAIVLTLAFFQAKVFADSSYTALVIVCLLCTAFTIPLMRLVIATSPEARTVVYGSDPDAGAPTAPVMPTEPIAAEATSPLVTPPKSTG